MLNPKVTIVIPCYNHGIFLPETLASIDAQIYCNYEVVVVNDGSDDPETIRVLNGLTNTKYKVLHTTNRGVSAARNLGIRTALGEYILPLDADDCISPDFLTKTVAMLESNSRIGIVCGERQLFGERQGVVPLPDFDSRRILVENLLYPASLYRKCDWASVGGYNEKMVSGWEDWDFWIALISLGKEVCKLPEVIFFYRVRSISRDHSLKFYEKIKMFSLMALRNWRLYLKHFPFVVSSLVNIHVFRYKD